MVALSSVLGVTMAWLELKLPPLLLWLLVALAISVPPMLDAAAWWPPMHASPFAWGGVLCLLLGICCCVLGVVSFRLAHTTVNPLHPAAASHLVESGIYRFSRNPMYLGFALMLLGIACWWQSWFGLCWVVAFIAYLQQFQIKPEERALQQVFGEAYLSYCQRVRRWC